MLKYMDSNYNFISEEEFMKQIKEHCESEELNGYNITFEQALQRLNEYGRVFFLRKKEMKKGYPNWINFYMADEEVFDMENIIMDNEADPLDGDSFAIAFAIYKAGWRKQQ